MKEKVTFIGHIQQDSKRIQLLKDHLINSKLLAESYAKDLGLPHVAGLSAMVHDLGKYRLEFQRYINDPDGKRGSVDHSTFGALFIKQKIEEFLKKYQGNPTYLLWFGEIIENAILSHHNTLGLKDYVDLDLHSPFIKRMERYNSDNKIMQELSEATDNFYLEVIDEHDFNDYFVKAFNEFKNVIKKSREEHILDNLYFISTYIYSCLLDADRTDTATFCLNQSAKQYNYSEIFKNYYCKLRKSLLAMNKNSSSKFNLLRQEMSNECDDFANNPDGVYRLSIPTGGGKTLSGMRYALKHAVLTKKKHIFCILPYITIIEQNANVYRKFLNGNELDGRNILEFHSNVTNEIVKDEDESSNILSLAEANFDSPITVTTTVQFLNCIYGSGTSNRRRFHNLCNSILIFDEVQKLPSKCLAMFNKVVNFFSEIGKSTIVLCTATQPALSSMKNSTSLNLSDNAEIIKDLSARSAEFKRVKLVDLTRENNSVREKQFSAKELSNVILKQYNKTPTILVVLNTIKATMDVFNEIKNTNVGQDNLKIYCLTTRMCPKHREKIISEIQSRLLKKLPTICVATPLVEAGIDFSFETVFRSVCGLDSIVQAAGRCNRNHERKFGQVFIVKLNKAEENLEGSLDEIKIGQDIVLRMFNSPDFEADQMLNPNVIEQYFNTYDSIIDEKHLTNYPIKINSKKIELAEYIDGKRFEYCKYNPKTYLRIFSGNETIAKYFKVIDDSYVSVLTPYGHGKDLISLLNGHEYDYTQLSEIFRQAQSYMINIYKNNVPDLIGAGIIYKVNRDNDEFEIFAIKDGYYHFSDEMHVDDDSGLQISEITKNESIIF